VCADPVRRRVMLIDDGPVLVHAHRPHLTPFHILKWNRPNGNGLGVLRQRSAGSCTRFRG
jgi:hypothetical protein